MQDPNDNCMHNLSIYSCPMCSNSLSTITKHLDQVRARIVNGETVPELRKDYLFSKIEGITGTLKSVPWHMVSIEDMEKILNALNGEDQ